MPRKERNKVANDDETEDTEDAVQESTRSTRCTRNREQRTKASKKMFKETHKKKIDCVEEREGNADDADAEVDVKNYKISKTQLKCSLASKTLDSDVVHTQRKLKIEKSKNNRKDESKHDTPRMTLRCRNPCKQLQAKKIQEIISSNSDYDADSENDVKTSNVNPVKCKLNSLFRKRKDDMQDAKRTYSKEMDTSIDFQKQEMRTKLLLSPKSSSSMESSDVNSDNGTSGESSKFVAINKDARSECCRGKENVIPCKSHSTPAISIVTQKLDDSLFGFKKVKPTLPFSPVITGISSICITTPIPSITYSKCLHKRAVDSGALGFDDFPIEAPKKRQRKKKENKSTKVALDMLDDLRLQFQEVEMHELVIE